MQRSEQQSLHEAISTNIDSLTPQLRIAADYVVEHPDEVASRSLRYIANVTQLTPPTFSRLAKALGYINYENLRDACRKQLKNQKLTFAEKALALQNTEDSNPENGTFVVRQGAASINNINTLLNTIDTQQLEDITSLLSNARRVLLVGTMSSRPFVDYMGYMASMAFENWQVFNQETASLAATLSGLSAQDVVLIISKAPYSKQSIEMARSANTTGATIIGITDHPLSPLALFSNALLQVNTESPQFFSSHVATLVLIESIIGMTVAKSGEPAQSRIAAVESTSHKMGEYWSRR